MDVWYLYMDVWYLYMDVWYLYMDNHQDLKNIEAHDTHLQ